MLLLLIHILKSSTKNSENGLLIETQLEKYFPCDIASVKSRIRYRLLGSVDAMSFWYNYVFTIVISAYRSFFLLFIHLFIYLLLFFYTRRRFYIN